MNSIDYYNQHALDFFHRTIDADLSERYERFLSYLPPKARILDAGCGPGRDTLFFKKKGFEVDAFDGSIEMVSLSTQLTGVKTQHLLFQDIEFNEIYDAIWASAALLHIPYDELPTILGRLHRALKPSGILYASFKYGCGQRQDDTRTFYDMDEKNLLSFFDSLFHPLHIAAIPDARSKAPSPQQAWLIAFAQKKPAAL